MNVMSQATLTVNEAIRRQAERLAADAHEVSTTVGVYWFPHEQEVRLAVTDRSVDPLPDGRAVVFYFKPSPEDGLDSGSATALIRPEEFGKAELPESWQPWEDAVEIPERA